MDTFRIPATIQEMVSELNGLDQLLTAKGWQRIGIVYAWTEAPAGAGRPVNSGDRPNNKLSIQAFADLGIYGLSDPKTVRRLRGDWVWALEHGGWDGELATAAARNLKPGDVATLPSLDVRTHAETMGKFREGLRWSAEDTDAITSVETLLDRRPAVREAIKETFITETVIEDAVLVRRLEDAFVQKAGQDTELAHRVFRSYGEHHGAPKMPKPAPTAADLGLSDYVYTAIQKEVNRGLPRLLDYLSARTAAEYPNTREVAQEEIDGLENGVSLLRQCQDKIREAVGIDVDTVFNRLVGKE